jgi:hypothetical protein
MHAAGRCCSMPHCDTGRTGRTPRRPVGRLRHGAVPLTLEDRIAATAVARRNGQRQAHQPRRHQRRTATRVAGPVTAGVCRRGAGHRRWITMRKNRRSLRAKAQGTAARPRRMGRGGDEAGRDARDQRNRTRRIRMTGRAEPDGTGRGHQPNPLTRPSAPYRTRRRSTTGMNDATT